MTNEQAMHMLKAKLECLKRETSGTDFDCNNSNCDECSLCYEQGNMGEQKEALDMAIKALEQLTSAQQEVLAHGEGELSAQPEMIRCKDCIHFDKYIDCKEMYQWDGGFCADWARNTYENWYCSRAERRNDG